MKLTRLIIYSFVFLAVAAAGAGCSETAFTLEPDGTISFEGRSYTAPPATEGETDDPPPPVEEEPKADTRPRRPPLPVYARDLVRECQALVIALESAARRDRRNLDTYRQAVDVLNGVVDLADRQAVAGELINHLAETLEGLRHSANVRSDFLQGDNAGSSQLQAQEMTGATDTEINAISGRAETAFGALDSFDDE